MKLTRRGLIAASGLLAPGVAAAADEVTFPFQVMRNHPWTGVIINGKQPALPFLLHSGAEWFSILDTTAKELKLASHGRIPGWTLTDRVEVPVYSGDALVGGAVRHDDIAFLGVRTCVSDQLVGVAPLTRFNVMAFDFDTQQVVVSRRRPQALDGYTMLNQDPGDADAGSLERLGAFSRSTDYQQFRDNRPIVHAELDRKPVKLLVDTGWAGSVMLYPDYVKQQGLWDSVPKFAPVKISRSSALGDQRLAKLERLKLGKFVFANPHVLLRNPADPDNDRRRLADGVIGMEIMRRLNFINDPIRREMWIKPNSAIVDGYRYNRTGLHLSADGDGAILDVQAGSPADRAGLRADDMITGWRGRDGVEGLVWAMTGAPGSKVEIQVERDGKPQMISVALADPF